MRFVKHLLKLVILVALVAWAYQERANIGPALQTAVTKVAALVAPANAGSPTNSGSSTTSGHPSSSADSHASAGGSIADSTPDSATNNAATASGVADPATPTTSIVQGLHLNATYYYQFSAALPVAGRTVFQTAVTTYNQTGIVKLIAGAAPSGSNTITFSLYHKQMPTNQADIELGEGGPKIIQRTNWRGTTVQNQGSASLNGDYPAAFSAAVAIHELGHALGLAHSNDRQSVMYPVDQGSTTLTAADLAGLRSIYAASK